jgi:hypothetical protein
MAGWTVFNAKVVKELGRGACGIVYAAEDPESQTILFAIKKSSMKLDQSPTYPLFLIKGLITPL